MSLNPHSHYGEVELRVDSIESTGAYPYLGPDGVPAKAYHSSSDIWRASKDMCGPWRSEPDLKGLTQPIQKRRGSERENTSPDSVVVVLLPGFRYWRFGANGGVEELTGRVVCTADEAAQLVATTSATYA